LIKQMNENIVRWRKNKNRGGHRTSKTYKILLHITVHKILLDISKRKTCLKKICGLR